LYFVLPRSEKFWNCQQRNSDELFTTFVETRARKKCGAVETMKEITTELSTREKLDSRREREESSALASA
jgi:hypothetical protein